MQGHGRLNINWSFFAAVVLYISFAIYLYQPYFHSFGKWQYLWVLNVCLASIGCNLISRRWIAGFFGSFLAGAVYGFGPYILGLSIFHPTAGFLVAVIPWSFYPINKFWNLYPCISSVNIQKSNNLPDWNPILEENIKNHLELCLNYKKIPLIANDLNYFYYINQKNKEINIETRENPKILKELLTFLKHEWSNLHEIIPGKLFKFKRW